MTCPSCAAPLELHPDVVVAVCSYCDSALVLDEEGVRDSGRKSRLPQGFTRLYTGAEGAVLGRRFRVEGRVRYGMEGAFWDEWAVRLDDGLHWITEDDHELAFERHRARLPVGDPGELRPGSRLDVAGRNFVVEELGEATCLGIEGRLPRGILPGERYRYADGSSPDGRYTLGIEWDADRPAIFVGQWVRHEQLALDDEGLAW